MISNLKGIALLIGLLWVCASVMSEVVLAGSDRLASIKQEIRQKFPTVAQLSPRQLQKMLEGSSGTEILLLDVREPKEFNVSHLKNAQLSPTLDKALALLQRLPKATKIVAYCSVGYRSSELVEKLNRRGFKNVYNLEGSLFEWANQDLPVYLAGKRVYEVHPYNFWWGRYLRKIYHP